jgi:uncharacterized protein
VADWTVTMLAQLAWTGFAFVYAATNLLAVLVIAGLRDRAFFKRPSKAAVRELQIGMFEFRGRLGVQG